MKEYILTTDQLLDLSGLVSNRVEELTGLPVTESEDAHLAITIGQWATDTGIRVIDADPSDPVLTADPSPSDPSGGTTPHPEEKTPPTHHSAHGKGIL